MGNLHGWGGPPAELWDTTVFERQRFSLERMRSLGIIPILPAFGGHVPHAITKYFPNASVSHLCNWGNFEPKYSWYVLGVVS